MKLLEPRVYAYIKGGGKEDFGSWKAFNKGATQQEIKARMNTYHRGKYDALKEQKRTHNLSSKYVHAHHEHAQKGEPKSRKRGKSVSANSNIHLELMHPKQLKGKKTDPMRLRRARTLALREKVIKDSKKFNKKCHKRSMKHVLAKQPWIRALTKQTKAKEK